MEDGRRGARPRARRAPGSEGYPALARQFRDTDGRAAAPQLLLPRRAVRAAATSSRSPSWRAAASARSRCTSTTTATPRPRCAPTSPTTSRKFAAHGHLVARRDGRLRYAFIHGNWCLANARRDGRWCGVDDEIPLLLEIGCYADFTFPSAPDECQPNIVNQIYWPVGDLARRRAYEEGERARVGERARRSPPDDRRAARARARRAGLGVRIENGACTAAIRRRAARVRTWVAQGIHVEGRPEWVFVKVHTHGAPEKHAASLLGDGGRALHQALRRATTTACAGACTT